ncbi:FAD binding domain-containing protein [Peptostreptococcus equinus]|uniref:Xanthine dehydrogenase family protein subunit M n=1 Tax=Peptostreptococcus equinus TaxID=3003601 RepID=A0ABY7JQ06_9FIRM|nr:xanthine dehydrogenase family protein subunit M [Peptostreptococcus sp. CBA3647]WAW14581.1 xanthine dehydrogenase family protein subunit M [Peptostreptococcus sp. CBA3647]
MNILSNFQYHAPKTKAEVLDLLADIGDKSKMLAGGTDLVIMLKEKMIQTENVINIADVKELSGIKFTDNGVEIGACTTISEIENSKELVEKYGALVYAASQLGSYQVRTMATIGGNISHSSPCGETPAPLSALNATVVIESKRGERTVKPEDFILGNRQNILEKDEMVTKFIIPEPVAHSAATYGNIGLRNAMEIDAVNMAVNIELEDDKKTIKSAKLIMGSVAPKPIVSEGVPSLLVGKELNDELIEKVGEAAMSEATPISDVRASAEYRKDVVGALARRLTKEAYNKAMEA